MRIQLNMLKRYFNQKTKQTNAIIENNLQITACFFLILCQLKLKLYLPL